MANNKKRKKSIRKAEKQAEQVAGRIGYVVVPLFAVGMTYYIIKYSEFFGAAEVPVTLS